MIRLIFFTVALFLLGFFLQQGASDAGEVFIRWYGYEIKTQALFLATAIILFCLVFFFFGQLWAFLVQVPYTFEKWRYKRKYEQGFNYFLLGLEAINTDENKIALKYAKKAQKLLPNKNLTNNLMAKSMANNNNSLKAIGYYEKLLIDDSSKFLGLKGLIEEFYKQKNWNDLKDVALKAYNLKPKNSFVIINLFEASMYEKDFGLALSLINKLQKYGKFDLETLDNYEAFMFFEISKNKPIKDKIKFLEKSLKAQKSFLLPCLDLINIYLKEGNTKQSFKILNKYFKISPSIQIYNLWLKLIKVDNNKYYKRRLKSLLKGNEKSFIAFYIEVSEYLRLNKLENAFDSASSLYKEKPYKESALLLVECANKLNKSDIVESVLKDIENLNNYNFISKNIINDYNKWYKKYINRNLDSKLLDYK